MRKNLKVNLFRLYKNKQFMSHRPYKNNKKGLRENRSLQTPINYMVPKAGLEPA
jgi:hypothetical protein